jgi:hypothetical protein
MATINILPPNPASIYDRNRVRSIMRIERTDGDGSPGTVDTYTIFFTDATETTYQVWNGANGADGDGPEGSGTVTSVALTVPTGLLVSGSPITGAGTLAITLAAGRVIPTQAQLDALAPKVAAVETITGNSPTLTTVGGEIKVWTLTDDSTLALDLDSGEALTLHVTLDSHALTIPGVRWPDGIAPMLHPTHENVIEFWGVGSVIYGAYVGAFPAPLPPPPPPPDEA